MACDSFQVQATGYSSEPRQTDSTPFITSTGARVRLGVLAVSQDLLPLLPYNTPIFVVADTMHPRIKRTLDFWFESRAEALRWGRRNLELRVWP